MAPSVAKRVLRNIVFNTTTVIIGRVAGLILTVILARLLLPELFGYFALALSVASIFQSLVDSGTSSAIIRYVAAAVGKKQLSLARGYFRFLFRIRFWLSLLVGTLLFIFAKQIAIYVFNKAALILPLQALAPFIILQTVFGSYYALFYAVQKVKYATASMATYDISRVIFAPTFIFFASYFGLTTFLVESAVIALSISTLLASFVVLFFAFTKEPEFFKKAAAPIVGAVRAKLLKFLGFISIGIISGIVFAYIDIIMLGIFLPAQFAGFYRASVAIVFAIIGLISVTAVLFPVFTQFEGRHLLAAFQQVFKYSAILSIPCAFGLALIAQPTVRIIFGQEYIPAAVPLLLLSFLIIEGVNSSLYSTLFYSKEQPKWPTISMIIATFMNIILNYFMILRWGMFGAAMATLISRYFNFIVLAVLARQKLKITPLVSLIYKPIAAALVMTAVLLFLPLPSIIIPTILLKIVLGAAVYFGFLWVLKGISTADVLYMKKLLK